MGRPMVVFGDAAAALANALREGLAGRSERYAQGVTVGTITPIDRKPYEGPTPLVVVRQDGPGTEQNLANTQVTIRISVWHEYEDDAFDLAQLVSAILRNHSGPVVRSIISGLSPATTTDPDTGEPLASATMTANVRARVITN